MSSTEKVKSIIDQHQIKDKKTINMLDYLQNKVGKSAYVQNFGEEIIYKCVGFKYRDKKFIHLMQKEDSQNEPFEIDSNKVFDRWTYSKSRKRVGDLIWM